MADKKNEYYSAVTPALAQNEVAVISVPQGRYMKILKATYGDDTDLQIEVNQGQNSLCFKGLGLDMRAADEITELRIKNLNASANTVVVGISTGVISDDRASIDANIVSDSTIVGVVLPDGGTSGKTSCADASVTQIIAGNANRKSLRISNPSNSAGSVWVSTDSGVADGEGTEIKPGDTLPFNNLAAIYARNDTGSAVVIGYFEE